MLSVKIAMLNLDLNILKGLRMLTSFIAISLLFGCFVMSQLKDVAFLYLFCTKLLLNEILITKRKDVKYFPCIK